MCYTYKQEELFCVSGILWYFCTKIAKKWLETDKKKNSAQYGNKVMFKQAVSPCSSLQILNSDTFSIVMLSTKTSETSKNHYPTGHFTISERRDQESGDIFCSWYIYVAPKLSKGRSGRASQLFCDQISRIHFQNWRAGFQNFPIQIPYQIHNSLARESKPSNPINIAFMSLFPALNLRTVKKLSWERHAKTVLLSRC